MLALLWDRFGLAHRRWLRGRAIRIGPLRTHTTSLISGLLFAGIGALFLFTSGTATIGGPVGVDAQYDLQVWLERVTRTATDVSVLFVVALILLAILVIRAIVLNRRDRSRDGAESSHPECGAKPPAEHGQEAQR